MKPVTLVHLYPAEMNIYGDTGNVLVLRRRLEWRDIPVRVIAVSMGDPWPDDADIVLAGGGQDAAQNELGADFVDKGEAIRDFARDGGVMLAICGSYQLLGHEFRTKDGLSIPGIGLLDVTTVGSDTRLIGNHVITSDWGTLVGYENHSGLTTLGAGVSPLGQTVTGRGNNGTDHTEGAVLDNVFGTYLHGPVLAKSPQFADELLRRALRRKGAFDALEPLDDSMAFRAAGVAAGRPR
jgi:CobQ-like glutamine amidotransferase family enzyme